ncbi:MAG TPA: pyridoxal phosphate-dependent aminotransferase [Methylomusa anaerophila]|uniref:Aminotransferase n=1 Tax=Methylomusa anaerophila TaxID=1930071 RepID=A0A348AGR9_9FIRM|nr:pyridoxal phosphate-dependent aminotransferase [Methylomusa anaerophila]BBB90267.1 aspartate aminotransferase [Methylomusa anaerophila]HML89387.1 pyridoxal phosphate-dependent aminotransferase [Methylomusa anaerophila]
MNKRLSRMDSNIGAEFRSQLEYYKRTGKQIIALNLGEPDFQTPEHICQAAIGAIENGFTKYTPIEGIYELREAICTKLREENHMEYTPDDIIVCTGAKQALANALCAICNEADEVLIPTPCWGSYPEMVKLVQATPVFVDTLENGSSVLTLDKIERRITPKTKAILLTNPHNPTGTVYSKELLQAIGNLANEGDFYIVADEIYEYLTYEGDFVSVAALGNAVKARTVTVNGLSKSFAMTGWRVGYAAGPKPVIDIMRLIQSYTTSNANSISQKAAVAALSGPREPIQTMVEEFDRRRRFIVERLKGIKGLSYISPQGAFYIMVNVAGYFGKSYKDYFIGDSTDFVMYILHETSVLLTPGVVFQAPAYVRIAYANSMTNLETAMDRLETALYLLK